MLGQTELNQRLGRVFDYLGLTINWVLAKKLGPGQKVKLVSFPPQPFNWRTMFLGEEKLEVTNNNTPFEKASKHAICFPGPALWWPLRFSFSVEGSVGGPKAPKKVSNYLPYIIDLELSTCNANQLVALAPLILDSHPLFLSTCSRGSKVQTNFH